MTAALLLTLAEYWLWVGAVVALAFLTFGIDRIDEDARGTYIFRPLLVPGVLMLWPLVLWRWAVLELDTDNWLTRYRPEIRMQVGLGLGMAVLIAVIALGGMAVRQQPPANSEPVRLEAAQ